MTIYYNPETGLITGPEMWEEGTQPQGHLTQEEWDRLYPYVEPAADIGNVYEVRDGVRWKIRFTRKEFMLHCGDSNMDMLINVSEDPASPARIPAKRILMLLNASTYIDVQDPDTVRLVQGLKLMGLSTADAARILEGERCAEAD